MSDAQIIVDTRSLQDAIAIFNAAPEAADRALKKSVSKVTRWAGNEARRRVAKSVKVSGRVIKGRIGVYFHTEYGRVFVGLWSINLKHLKPHKTPEGVQAGPIFRKSAFIVEKLGGNVFERVGSKRLPIKMSDGMPIEKEGRAAVLAIAKEVEPRIVKEFERNLSWQRYRK